MCCEPLSVRLHVGGRHFTCPCCGTVRDHPPADSFLHSMQGRAFCDFCGRWMRIDNYRTFASEAEADAARTREE